MYPCRACVVRASCERRALRFAASCLRRACVVRASFCVVHALCVRRACVVRASYCIVRASCCVALRLALRSVASCVALRCVMRASYCCSVLRMRVVVYIRTCTSFAHLVIH